MADQSQDMRQSETSERSSKYYCLLCFQLKRKYENESKNRQRHFQDYHGKLPVKGINWCTTESQIPTPENLLTQRNSSATNDKYKIQCYECGHAGRKRDFVDPPIQRVDYNIQLQCKKCKEGTNWKRKTEGSNSSIKSIVPTQETQFENQTHQSIVEEVKEPDTKRLKVSDLKKRNQSMEIEKPDEDISNLNHLQCKVRDLESQVADLKRKLEEKERFIKELQQEKKELRSIQSSKPIESSLLHNQLEANSNSSSIKQKLEMIEVQDVTKKEPEKLHKQTIEDSINQTSKPALEQQNNLKTQDPLQSEIHANDQGFSQQTANFGLMSQQHNQESLKLDQSSFNSLANLQNPNLTVANKRQSNTARKQGYRMKIWPDEFDFDFDKLPDERKDYLLSEKIAKDLFERLTTKLKDKSGIMDSANQALYMQDKLLREFYKLIAGAREDDQKELLLLDSYFLGGIDPEKETKNQRLVKQKCKTNSKYVIIPIHCSTNQHWTFAIIDFENEAVSFVDTLGSTNALLKDQIRKGFGSAYSSIPKIKCFIKFMIEKHWQDKDQEHFKLSVLKTVEQKNLIDCGILVCYLTYVFSKRCKTEDITNFKWDHYYSQDYRKALAIAIAEGNLDPIDAILKAKRSIV